MAYDRRIGGRARSDLKSMIRSIHYNWTWDDDTSIKEALYRFGLVAAEKKTLYGTGFTLIVLTDGEEAVDPRKQRFQLEAKSFQSIHAYFAGHGTLDGAPIPQYDNAWRFKQYRQDFRGVNILSRLDEKSLKDLARLLGGSYKHMETGSDLARLAGDKAFRSAEYDSEMDVGWAFWLGSAALLVLAMII